MSEMIKPVKKQTELNVALIPQQSDGDPVNKDWLLLDNQSTITVFYNPKFLCDIRTRNSILTVHCNAGATKIKLIDDLLGYGTVWFLPNEIMNILSLVQVVKQFHVTFNSENDNAFFVHKTSSEGDRYF